jgi:DNA helicase HerA-like ATPase
MSDSIIEKDSIFRIGRVVSIEGRSVNIVVDKSKNNSHLIYKNALIKNVSVGSLIKIIKGFIKIICKVEGEYTTEDIKFSSKVFANDKEKIKRMLKVSLLGFFEGEEFKRGIKEMPLMNNTCYLLDDEEFGLVHRFVASDDTSLQIGKLSLENDHAIELGVDSLFASHIGIFGNTGSGKSYTLAKLYHSLLEKFKTNDAFKKNAKFVLIDFNGEYINRIPQSPDFSKVSTNVIVESEHKTEYILSTRNPNARYPISSSAFEDISLLRVLLDATEKTQVPFLGRALRKENKKYIKTEAIIIQTINNIVCDLLAKADKEHPYEALTDFFSDISDVFLNSNISDIKENFFSSFSYDSQYHKFYFVKPEHNQILSNESDISEINEHAEGILKEIILDNDGDLKLSVLMSLKLQILFSYHREIARGYSQKGHLRPLIQRMDNRFADIQMVISIDQQSEQSQENNFVIISLRDVNIEMKKVLPLLICRTLYDSQKKNISDDTKYLNIIIDEAHNILSSFSERESEDVRDYRLETFEEFIKEGRKFGVFLTIASQRPADISPTIISQLHNFFLHRLINNRDIEAVEKSITYLDKVSFDYLPILPTGSCIIAGLSAQIPVVVDISEIDAIYEPNNKTRKLVQNWIALKAKNKS